MNQSLFGKKHQGVNWLLKNREVVEGTLKELKGPGGRFGKVLDTLAAEKLQVVAPAGIRLSQNIIKDFRLKVGLKVYSRKPKPEPEPPADPKLHPVPLGIELAGKKQQTRVPPGTIPPLPSCRAVDILPRPGIPELPYAKLARTCFPELYILMKCFPRGHTMLVQFASAVADAATAEYRQRERGRQSGDGESSSQAG